MPLQRDKAKQLHARRNFRPHPRVTPKAIVRERIDTVRKKGIYLLPNLFTLSSLFSGFYAVIIAMAGDFEKAAIAIFVSMILDGCDGRVARLTHTQSSFGVQFDSLADMCAFGMAPAMVVYQWALHDLGRLGWAAPSYTAPVRHFAWLASMPTWMLLTRASSRVFLLLQPLL